MPRTSPLATPRVRADVDEAFFDCTSFSAGHNGTWVYATGELDIAAVPRLERVLDEAQLASRLVVLDLHDLAFIDTSGVHVIVAASRYARIAGHRLVVLHGPQIRHVFDLTRTLDELDIHSLAAAPLLPVR